MRGAEAYDDESFESLDDESFDDEGILGDIGNILTAPITAPISAISKLVGGKPSRPPLSAVQIPRTGGGVDTATLTTPKGSATVRMPEKVVTEQAFLEATQRLQSAINRNTDRLNTTQKDIQSLTQRVGVVVTDTQRDVAKAQKEQRIALARLRKEQSSQSMMNMVISLMTQTQIQKQLASHCHSNNLIAPLPSTAQGTPLDTSDNTMMMLLPMMMMGSPSGGPGEDSSNMMMMMVMAMAMGSK